MNNPIFRSRITIAILGSIFLWMGFLGTTSTIRRVKSQHQLAILEQQIEDHERGNERIARDLERMKEPEWLALLARQRLNWRAPEEQVVFVYKSEKSDTISQPESSTDQRSNLQKWKDWMFHAR
jgi:cell division protein FtsB